MSWLEGYKNFYNLEHWLNNKMKGYIYAIGLTSLVFLPLIILIDCFKPLLGRGPHAQQKKKKPAVDAPTAPPAPATATITQAKKDQ